MKHSLISTLLLSLCTLTACSSQPKTLQDRIVLINQGMVREQVLEILGAPGNRSFNSNLEALQYCETNNHTDFYVTLLLKDGTVRTMNTSNTSYADGLCRSRFTPVDWNLVK